MLILTYPFIPAHGPFTSTRPISTIYSFIPLGFCSCCSSCLEITFSMFTLQTQINSTCWGQLFLMIFPPLILSPLNTQAVVFELWAHRFSQLASKHLTTYYFFILHSAYIWCSIIFIKWSLICHHEKMLLCHSRPKGGNIVEKILAMLK